MTSHSAATPCISVLMPTFEQARFIGRAIESLLTQSLSDWELEIIDDGSEDDTAAILSCYLGDPRIRYLRLRRNHGLGAALNYALERARAPLVAYLPSDDVIYSEHLASLRQILDANPQAVLAYSGVRHHYNRSSPGAIAGYPLQLVQALHRRGAARWTERGELVTDDLDRMFWSKLRGDGEFVASGRVTCEWVDHPQQRHKLIREPLGGINPYRQRYRVKQPLRFHSSVGNRINEIEQYQDLRRRAAAPPAFNRLKVLLVGELAYNADRIVALEQEGHKLYGLWMRDPYWYNTVGPLPFGRIEDVPAAGWRDSVKRIAPDVIYALLNWQAVPFAHQVLEANPGIPFVWHFKEGPFICLEKGTWPLLFDLYSRADGQIFSSAEMRDWFDAAGLARASDAPRLVLDGDLPKRDWFSGLRSPLLSRGDGEIHTVVPGRPIGLHPPDVATLAAQGVHLHFYGDFTQGQWRGWIDKAMRLAPRHLHLHANVDQSGWVEEFSKYDAGWLHFFRSDNDGDVRRANWDDLNYPARLGTFAAAGLPLIQRDNPGAIVATQRLAQQLDIGLFAADMDDLAAKLRDRPRLEQLRENMWQTRHLFTFDHHVRGLTDFFRQVADQASKRTRAPAATAAAEPTP